MTTLTNGISAVEETISVDKAKQMLEKNKLNRPISQRNLDQLISTMKKGNFKFTGESIKISKAGNLLDGQHRLMAAVQTNQPIRSLVVRGLEEDSFKYMDTGRPRRASDVLGIEGYPNPTRFASVALFVMNFKKNKFSKMADGAKSKGVADVITNADISEFVAKNHESISESLKYGHMPENKLVSPTTLAAFHYIFKEKHSATADDFCDKLVTGISLTKSNPIYLLRQSLIGDARATRKMKRLVKLAIICKTWNAVRNNKIIKNLKWEPVKESFPKPI